MAFAAVPLALGAFESLGITAAAVESGVIVSETVGLEATVGANVARLGIGAAAGAIGSQVGSVVEQGVDEIFGQGTAAGIEKDVGEGLNTIKDALGSFLTGDIDGFKRRMAQKQEDARRFQEALDSRQREIDASNQFYYDSMRSGFDNTQPGQGLYVDKQFDDIKLSSDQQQSVNEINQMMGQVFSGVNTFINDRSQQIEKAKKIALDLAEFLKHDLSQNLHKNPEEALDSFNTQHYLSESVLTYMIDKDMSKYIPNDEMYRQISQTYNGRRIVKESVFMEERNDGSGLRIFAGYEEDGQVAVYFEHGGIKLPTLWPGTVWVGPQSPNNALPVDLYDTFSFYHDVSYQQNGWFDRVGDYKYISRLTQNMDRFPSVQIPAIKATIIYFSSVGTMLSYFNNQPIDIPTPEQVNQQFEQFNQNQVQPIDTHFLNYVDSNIDVNAEIIKVFSDTLTQKMMENTSIIIQSSVANQQAEGLRTFGNYALENLEVQLI